MVHGGDRDHMLSHARGQHFQRREKQGKVGLVIPGYRIVSDPDLGAYEEPYDISLSCDAH